MKVDHTGVKLLFSFVAQTPSGCLADCKMKQKKRCSINCRKSTYYFFQKHPIIWCYYSISGSSNTDRDQRWVLAGRVHANGWGAMEATTQLRVFNICGYKEGALPLTNYQWWRPLAGNHFCGMAQAELPRKYFQLPAWGPMNSRHSTTFLSRLHEVLTVY